jgi:hypothetical protein
VRFDRNPEREAAAVAKRERKAALKARNVARSWANNYYTLKPTNTTP